VNERCDAGGSGVNGGCGAGGSGVNGRCVGASGVKTADDGLTRTRSSPPPLGKNPWQKMESRVESFDQQSIRVFGFT